jgi:thymidylate synthase (FAD)
MKKITPSIELAFPINAEEIMKNIELAGRTCYKSEDKITPESSGAFVKRLIKSGHESVLEHEKISLRCRCDRGVSHEIVRHRMASYSQESTRYCDYAGEIAVIEIRPFMDDAQYQVWTEAMHAAEQTYIKLRGLGVPPQIARSVLPNSLKTEIVWTANLREWRLVFKQRTASGAHPQMKEVMCQAKDLFIKLLPDVFGDLKD